MTASIETTDAIDSDFARRLRDIERAGRLRLLLVSAETGAWESARFCAFTQHDGPQAVAHGRAALYYGHLYRKVVRLQEQARGEAADV